MQDGLGSCGCESSHRILSCPQRQRTSHVAPGGLSTSSQVALMAGLIFAGRAGAPAREGTPEALKFPELSPVLLSWPLDAAACGLVTLTVSLQQQQGERCHHVSKARPQP